MLVYWLKIKTPESIENQLEYIIKNLDEKKLNLFARGFEMDTYTYFFITSKCFSRT